MRSAPARLLLLCAAVLLGGSFLYFCFRQAHRPHFQDFGYFLWQAAILDRFGSPWDAAARSLAQQHLRFPHTISVAHYPPAFFLLLVPLSRLPYDTAALLWFFLALAALAVALTLLWRAFFAARHAAAGALLALLVLGAFYPLRFNLSTGQNNLLALGLIVLGAELLARRRGGSGGSAFALAALVKIVPLVLAAPLLLRREWRALGSMFVVFAALNALILAVLPPSVFGDFLRATAYKMSTDAHCELSFSVYALAWRLTGSFAAARAAQSAGFLFAIALAAWLTRRHRDLSWPELAALWSSVFLIGSAFLGEAHLVFALPALFSVTARLCARWQAVPALLCAIALLLIGAEYHIDGFRFVWQRPFTSLLNLKLYGLLLLFALHAFLISRD